MKKSVIPIFIFFCGVLASPLQHQEYESTKPTTFPRVCSTGPTYWCQNITTAKECGAVKHCIQTVWEHMTLEADTDDICTICKDMVAQARDQLESNETQEELKEVFEGSCRLIPVKVIAKECIKLSDEFIPELVEALASQMNPQVVCATAGLCNSARIDKLLAQMKSNNRVQVITSDDPNAKFGKECSSCHKVVGTASNKLLALSDDQILAKMIKACGYMGSLSTGCHDVVISNFNEIVQHLRQHFHAKEVCHLAGVCKAMHHEHAQIAVEVVPQSEIGVRAIKKDETCELCEQLVKHLRDVLVSNTTEEEFKGVLTGICRQMRSFKQQCLSLVNEYYPAIYSFLVDELNPRTVCDLAGICHEELTSSKVDHPLWLELPARQGLSNEPVTLQEAVELFSKKEQLTGGDEAQSYGMLTGGDEAKSLGIQEVNAAEIQLPLERLMPQTLTVGNKQLCELCQYFLHYVQEQITSPSTEAEIKEVVDEACDHLPNVIRQQCRSFVATYGDAFVALLAQEIDPSQVCPKLGLCARNQLQVVEETNKGTPVCPLCLYVMEELQKLIKENTTEENIRSALERVCSLLPASMTAECTTFLDKYTDDLVDMLVAEVTPEEICIYLKMCVPQSVINQSTQDEKDAEIMTNEIPQLPETRLMPQTLVRDDELVQGVMVDKKLKDDNPKCVICEFVMTQLDDMLKNNATEEEIKNAVHTVCNYLPTSVAKQCNNFVYEYADLVIQLLVQELDPKAVCQELSLCQPTNSKGTQPTTVPQISKDSAAVCKLCMVIVEAMDKLLEDGNVEQSIDNLLEKVCTLVPNHESAQCRAVIDEYGPGIALLVAQLADSRDVCTELNLCKSAGGRPRIFGGSKCTWGPSYWCQSEFHAMACKATKHCQKKVWKAIKPVRQHGSN